MTAAPLPFPPGIHLIHKPVGPTSFEAMNHYVSANTREGRKPPRACHGGTLDPFAHGLLLVLVGPATRLFDFLHDIPKTYDATIRWGIETDNGDPRGKIVREADTSALRPADLDAALVAFQGWTDQTPHITSAKRIAGRRAYELAHRGESVEMPASRVYLHEARWLDHDLPRTSRLRLSVRGGFYVRALARDLGRALGSAAHLTALHRTAIGPHTDPGPANSLEVTGRSLLPWLPSRNLADNELTALHQRKPIPLGETLPPDWPLPENFPTPRPLVRAFHKDRLQFLLTADGDQLKPVTQLGSGV